jgi:hypothetical protein
MRDETIDQRGGGAVITRPVARARARQPQFGPPPLPKSNDV